MTRRRNVADATALKLQFDIRSVHEIRDPSLDEGDTADIDIIGEIVGVSWARTLDSRGGGEKTPERAGI